MDGINLILWTGPKAEMYQYLWFQIPVAERGELVRQGELTVCGGPRRKRAGIRNVFLYQHAIIFTKQKSPSPGRTTYSYKHSIKVPPLTTILPFVSLKR